jgi:hypothetical protein
MRDSSPDLGDGGNMRVVDHSELEQIIAAAEAAAVGPRVAALTTNDPGRAERTTSTNLMYALRQLGARHGELDRLRDEHEADLHRVAAESRRRSMEGAVEAWQRMDALARRERAVWQILPDDPWKPWSQVLLSVLFVRAWPTAGNLHESHLEPGLNFAKYRVRKTPAGPEKVSFYILWQNPRDVWVEADILVRLAAYGHGECHADGGGVGSWFGLTSRSEAHLSAQLTLWRMWTSPTTTVTVDNVPFDSFSASGGFFGDTDAHSINQAPTVSTSAFSVAPAGVVIIEASVVVDQVGLGSVDIDFASGAQPSGFSVGLPYAVVTLPPGSPLNVTPEMPTVSMNMRT